MGCTRADTRQANFIVKIVNSDWKIFNSCLSLPPILGLIRKKVWDRFYRSLKIKQFFHHTNKIREREWNDVLVGIISILEYNYLCSFMSKRINSFKSCNHLSIFKYTHYFRKGNNKWTLFFSYRSRLLSKIYPFIMSITVIYFNYLL